jgi:hypothetical protein
MHSYIYLIQTGDFINTDIYKIGRTTQKNSDTRSLNRLKSYSKNTIQKFLYEVPTSKVIEIEKEIIKEFNCKYQLKKGHEWFRGDCKNMITDINTIISKYVISDSFTIENKPSTNVLINKQKKPKPSQKKLSCSFCSKQFKTTYNTNRHETICKQKIKENIDDNDDNDDDITTINLFIDKIDIDNIDTLIIDFINNINNNTKPIYKTKKEKLNEYYNNSNTIDIKTFINNFKTNEKYKLNKDESIKLLDIYKNNGSYDFVDCFYEILIKKYHMQLSDLEYDTTTFILPFIQNDSKFRTHFEFTETGWMLTKSDNNLIDLIKITKNQIFDNCYEFIKLPPKRGVTTIYHFLLRKMDYNHIESKLK